MVHPGAKTVESTTTERVGDSHLLHEFFERQAARTPDATALLYHGNPTTYGVLDAQANRLAYRLREQGIGPGACVGLLLPRSELLYAALLAVLKAGAAYVPLDPNYPPDRVCFILGDCAASILLSSVELSYKAAEFKGNTILLDQDKARIGALSDKPVEHAQSSVGPQDLCYVIYTSGTTGRPKGVQIEHRNAAHLVQAEADLFGIHPADRVFQGFSIAFDASVEEIWLAFAAGATLVIGSEEMLQSGASLSRYLSEAGVTVLSCVPTLLSILEDDVPCLRLLILGGEVCPPELVKRWWRPTRRVVNTYGPTEATVVATWADCHPEKAVTIGRPLPGYYAEVLDERLQPVAPGGSGELVLGGLGIARGYLGQPELTKEKFIFRSADGRPAQRFYRTGDHVQWTPTGELEFLGRLDTQVKIRGFRVELSEIESVLLGCAGVKSAAAVLQDSARGISQLAAYIVPRTDCPPDLAEVRRCLKERLPPYMVPAVIATLLSLPTLPSGKVDRAALSLLNPKPAQPNPELAQPRSSLERQIVQIWAQLFDRSAVSIKEDFFLDLGGHSLLAARMVSELRRSADFSALSMSDVYRFPTAETLAQELESRRSGGLIGGTSSTSTRFDRGLTGASDHGLAGARPSESGAHAIPFGRHFLCGAAQLFSLVFVLSFFALQWLAPYLTYTILVEEEYDFATSVLGAFASLVLVYPVMLAVAIGLKWLIIGRFRPGCYPLWGWYYFRFWLTTAIEGTVPVSYLAGTPLMSIYLRLMGAKVGRNVAIQTDNFAIYDLLTVGDDSSINADASLLGYSVHNGSLYIGFITIGQRCFVGTRAVVCEGTFLEDGSALEDLSLLPAGTSIPQGQTWIGSPAQLQPVPAAHLADAAATEAPSGRGAEAAAMSSSSSSSSSNPGSARRFAFGLLHGIGMLVFPVLVVAALFPGIAVMNRLNYLDPYYWYLFLAPLVAVSFVGLLCFEIAALKWLLLGRIRPGVHPLDSWYYARKWFVDKTMELSLDVVGPLYASVYLSPWYKLLGARLGRATEISTASSISPDLLTVGDESFVADNVSLGAPRVQKGRIEIGPNQIGRRAFIGNSAMLPPGTVIGDSVLIGCLSVPPVEPEEALRADSGWIGSPALLLRQRLKQSAYGEEATFNPPARLRALRATIEFVRVITPSTGFIILTSLLFSALLLLHDHFSLGQTLFFFPALYLGCGLAAVMFTALLKWLLVGRYRPGEKPLWCTFVWRNELINALHEHLAGPFLVNSLTGTPFICWYFRLLGAHIGRRVYLDTIDFSEFDLARIGDEATLNGDCTVQTHLFEDRVMKMSHVDIGPGCSVGANSLVLYDTRMETASQLGPLSLLMKGETLPAGTVWAGSPARAINQERSPAAQ